MFRKSNLIMLAMATTAYAPNAFAQSYNIAQDSLLVDTSIPNNFDRDRNVSVTERPRPDYDPVGLRSGAFQISPQVQVGAGATDNVYLAATNTRSDVFTYFAPSVEIRSDLNRDEIRASAGALLGRYFDNSPRNQNSYNMRLLGRKDIGDAYSVTGEAQYARLYESPDNGSIDPATAILSTYKRSFLSLRGRYAAGQFQTILAVDRTAFSFDDVTLGDGTVFNQRTRDQVMGRVAAEVQYAISPSLSVYGQVSGSQIEYSRLLGNQENRDSTGVRALGGVNFDLAGLMRGKVGVGYITRDYDSGLYQDAKGFSVEALVEFFPTELTTVGVSLARTLKDTNIAAVGSAFFDNGARVSIDHELLVNLLLGTQAEYRRQVYVSTSQRTSFYRLGGNATYYANRDVALRGLLQFQRRATDDLPNNRFNEFRGELSVIFRR